MDFLVRITVDWPPDGDEERRLELTRAEAQRARELIDAGIIQRLWRVPGRWANIGIWSGPDATAVHEAIASLPLFPWLRAAVEPLAAHPNDPGGHAAAGPERS